MRRSDREITDVREIRAIIAACAYCDLALVDGKAPYVVPMCFGMEVDTVYMHAATEGAKLDILQANPQASLCFVSQSEAYLREDACPSGMHYRSAIVKGRARLVSDAAEVRRGLDAIMAQYGYVGQPEYSDASVATIRVIAVDIIQITAKAG